MYCKRVKYMDKAWILVQKEGQYWWVEQDKIPVERMKRVRVEEVEDKQEGMARKLEEL